MLLTGLHAVADICCNNCNTTLGWKYELAFGDRQKYKEGKFIVEVVHLLKENGWEWLPTIYFPESNEAFIKYEIYAYENISWWKWYNLLDNSVGFYDFLHRLGPIHLDRLTKISLDAPTSACWDFNNRFPLDIRIGVQFSKTSCPPGRPWMTSCSHPTNKHPGQNKQGVRVKKIFKFSDFSKMRRGPDRKQGIYFPHISKLIFKTHWTGI